MSIPGPASRRAFTLLEVMIATMIIGMLTLSVFRFVSSNLTAMRISNEISEERESLQAILRILQAQLTDLPQIQNALLGQPHKFRELPSDEMKWIARGGQGLMTTAAKGEYRVTFTVQPVDSRSTETELGLRREPFDADARSNAEFFTRGSGQEKYNWVTLLRPMAALEIRYYDPRVENWLDRWTDPAARPSLVRVRLWRTAEDIPLEAVIAIPAAMIQQ